MAQSQLQRLHAGEMNHRMILRAPVGVESESVAIDVDTDVPMKVAVLPPALQANESLALGGLNTQTKYNLSTWYREDVKLSYVWQEECCTQRTFQIVAIIPGDRREALQMTCVTNG